MPRKLVEDDFNVPVGIETNHYRLRMLTIQDVAKDFDAVVTSVSHIEGVLDANSSWPEGLTLEQNLIDIGWHQKEFQKRSSFAYTVMSPDEERCLGCVYIYPSETADADVFMWVRKDEFDLLDNDIFERVQLWLEQEWPFGTVKYPGRE